MKQQQSYKGNFLKKKRHNSSECEYITESWTDL